MEILRKCKLTKKRSGGKSTCVMLSIVKFKDNPGVTNPIYEVICYYENLKTDKNQKGPAYVNLEGAIAKYTELLNQHISRKYAYEEVGCNPYVEKGVKSKKFKKILGDPSTIAVDDSYYEFV